MSDTMDDPPMELEPNVLPGRFRLTMRTMMIAVLTAAMASALFSELWRLLKASSTSNVHVDVPTIVILGICLNAVAIGCWGRLTLEQTFIQIAICCLMVLTAAWIWESKLTRLMRYWLQLSFAVGVVLPLFVRTIIVDKKKPTPRTRRIASNINNIIFAYINFIIVLIVAVFQLLVLYVLSIWQ
ncbi:hypothetical protein SAMN05444166_3292 [Singulisphaera sp. GP187]|uniref:hypothetical protein n=1 Tax=Singulisphaera sp. GP187 TaxID=1882752 RepID=UPI00092B8F21|nr:hypothetical protein [Singulisphaera sp. GP187]SIO25828.1 hypothetical protein SAMN05444166_3292 [Singulisphaera sp. GP187]